MGPPYSSSATHGASVFEATHGGGVSYNRTRVYYGHLGIRQEPVLEAPDSETLGLSGRHEGGPSRPRKGCAPACVWFWTRGPAYIANIIHALTPTLGRAGAQTHFSAAASRARLRPSHSQLVCLRWPWTQVAAFT